MTDEEIIKWIGGLRLRRLESTFQKSYSFGDLFIKNSNFLNIPSAKCFWQNIINISIDYNITKACDDNLIDFTYKYEKNKKKNCEHLELRSNNILLTHSSINNNIIFPRKSTFRKYYSYTNQTCLLGNEPAKEPCYGILVHKRCETQNRKAEISLGIPDADYRSWAHLINITNLFNQRDILLPVEVEKEYNDFEIAIKSKIGIASN